jgi:AcrR family transcriptional regulator
VSTGATRGPGRPGRPGLSREFIVATALALIDREGLKALSMRRLGAELGVDPMAVYYYLPNKSALFDGLVEAIYAEVDVGAMPTAGSWRVKIEWFMRRLRDVLRRHPHALPVVGTRPATTPGILAVFDSGLGLVTGDGLAGPDAIDILNCVATFTIGHVLAEVGEPVGGDTAPQDELLSTVTPDTHPHLVKAFAEGYEYRPDEQYELGLRAMLDGFEARSA